MRLLLGSLLVILSISGAAETQRMYGPYFVADGSHTSRLLIHNKRGDRPVSAKAYASLGSERILLDELTLAPKQSRAIVIDRHSTGRASASGSLVLEYDFFEPQPLDASVMVQHRSGSRYVVPLFRRDQIRGNVQEAVILVAGPSARAFVAVQNTTNSPRTANIDVVGNGSSVRAASVLLEPGASQVVFVDSLLAKAGARDAAAIRVTNSGSPGDVTAAGAVTDPRQRYSARIRFNDLAHGEHNRTLRAQFLLLGTQEPSWGLPTTATFTAKCALRNPTEQVKIAHPRVKWLENGISREAHLASIRIQPHEVRILDLTGAQAKGEIPAAFRIGSFEISYEGGSGHLLAQLTSIDSTTGFALDDSMTSHESHAVAGMEWAADDENQTLISITNAAPRPDSLAVELFTATGSVHLPPLALASGELALLDVRALALTHGAGSSGTFTVRGVHGSRSAFRLERLIITPSRMTSDIGQEVHDGPVAYVDVDGEERVLWIRTDVSQPPEEEYLPTQDEAYVTLDLTTTARWSSGTATTNETDTTEYVTDDTAMLSIKPPPVPQVTIVIRRPPTIGELRARFYDPCANNYLLIDVLRFGLPASAYQIFDSRSYPICHWAAICSGTCSSSMITSMAVNTPACVPAGAPYIQCFGMTVNGRCIVRNGICHYQGVPGYCS